MNKVKMAFLDISIVLSCVFALSHGNYNGHCKEEHEEFRTTILEHTKDIGRLESLIIASMEKQAEKQAELQSENAQLKKEIESLKQVSQLMN